MNIRMDITGEEAWKLYKKIEDVVHKHREMFPDQLITLETDEKLQYLCQAVLIKYNLKKNDYRRFRFREFRIDVKHLDSLNLSNTIAMVGARFRIHEQGIPSVQVGPDTYTNGSPSGYILKDSLDPSHGSNYLRLAESVGVIFADVAIVKKKEARYVCRMYNSIEEAVTLQLTRVRLISDSPGITRDKALEIEKSLSLLKQAVIIQHHLSEELGNNVIAKNINKNFCADFSTIDCMLDATFSLHKTALPSFTPAIRTSTRNKEILPFPL